MAGTERLKVNLVQGENRVQTVVRGQIEVPDPKPDVDKILSKTADTKVRNVSIVPDKVIVEGTLSLQVTYIAFKPDQAVHSFEDDIKFTAFVDVAGAEPEDDYHIEFTVEDFNLTRNKKDPRKFDVATVLSTFAKITQVDELEILTETPEGNEALETADITVQHMIGEKETKQVIVSEEFDVPEEKPDVEKILNTKAEAVITDKRLVANKVIIDGEVRFQVLYVAMKPQQSVHNLHHAVKFTAFVEVPDAQPGMKVHVRAEVEAAEVETVLDPALRANAIVKLTVFVSETRTLVDVPTLLENENGFIRRRLKLDQEVGSGETQVVLRGTMAIPDPKPDIMKVLEAKVNDTKVTDTDILDGKVLIRGEVEVEVVYVSAEPDQAVHAMHQRLNFRTFVEVEGAAPGMDVDVRIEPEFVSAEQAGDSVHSEVVLAVEATVTEMVQLDVYVPGEEEEEPTVEPTVCAPTAYTVQKGDTLWNIARANGTTVQEILAINPQITNPDVLQVGQVIMVPCAAMG
jgi:nucleoid-associated protein YgaU